MSVLTFSVNRKLFTLALACSATLARRQPDPGQRRAGGRQPKQPDRRPQRPHPAARHPTAAKLQRFDRERIPERVVHARGAGAGGVFVASEGLQDVSRALVFRKGEKRRCSCVSPP